ncbi:MAG TPA: hypothetical protein VG873_18355 [Burkholderiales bacterium]|nr:hypothetical protein [Burkholderiales bacterium]
MTELSDLQLDLLCIGGPIALAIVVGVVAWNWPEILAFLAQLLERDLWG